MNKNTDAELVLGLEGMATDFHGHTEEFLLAVADRLRELSDEQIHTSKHSPCALHDHG